MTASEIEHRLLLSGLASEDQQELRRIFDCLSDTRKLEIFETWDRLIARIKARKIQYEEERALVLSDPLRQLAE